MPSPSQFDRIEIVLVSPRNPLNIGAAARAMANFGFSNLTVVAPYEPHWREAKSAVGAQDLLQNARCTKSLAEAVADCTLVVGTGTVDRRQPKQPVVPLPDLAPLVRAELGRNGRIALVFGPEKRGLTGDDLARCHVLVEIPTSPRQPSMNLGQAVAVCLYELSARLASYSAGAGATDLASETPERKASAEPAATSATLDLLAQVIDETMIAAHYSPAAMHSANRRDLLLLLRRLTISERDSRRILGLFRRILHRLRHSSRPIVPGA